MALSAKLRSGFQFVGWIRSIVWMIGIAATSGVVGLATKASSRISATDRFAIVLGVGIILTCLFLIWALSKGVEPLHRLMIVKSLDASTFSRLEPDFSTPWTRLLSEISIHNPNDALLKVVNVELESIFGYPAIKHIRGQISSNSALVEEVGIPGRATVTAIVEFMVPLDRNGIYGPTKCRISLQDQMGKKHKYTAKFNRNYLAGTQ